MTILVDPPSAPPIQGGERRFTSDLGYQIRLTRGYLSSQSIDLIACPGAAAPRRRFSWIREAHAHGGSTSTRLGFGRVESLLAAPGAPFNAGALAPPPGRYCELSLGLRAADEDAEGLPTDLSVVGETIHLEGLYVPPSGGAEVAFEGVTTASAVAKATIALELSEEGTKQVTLALGLATERWFDGVDLATLSREQIGRAVLQNLSAAAKASPR